MLKSYYSKYWFKEHQSSAELLMHKAFIWAAGFVYRLKYRKDLKKTERFGIDARRANCNRKVFVFANGPSLRDIDLQKVAELKRNGYDLIAINSFVSKSAHIVKPDYVVFADKIHFGLKSTDNEQYANDLRWCAANNVIVLAPVQYIHLVEADNKVAFNAFANTYSRNTVDISRSLGFYPLTALYALAIAKFLGYQDIYISGYDNSYFKSFEITEKNGVSLMHPHYYDEQGSNTAVDRSWAPTSEIFFDFYRHFKYIEKVVSGVGGVYNISKQTYLNTLPRNTGLDVYK